MSDVLEDTSCDELAFIGPVPEDLPFEVDKSSREEHGHAKKNACKFWEGKLPDSDECGERSNENDE